jgi:hypothetical protein
MLTLWFNFSKGGKEKKHALTKAYFCGLKACQKMIEAI